MNENKSLTHRKVSYVEILIIAVVISILLSLLIIMSSADHWEVHMGIVASVTSANTSTRNNGTEIKFSDGKSIKVSSSVSQPMIGQFCTFRIYRKTYFFDLYKPNYILDTAECSMDNPLDPRRLRR